jgi:ribonuclease T1
VRPLTCGNHCPILRQRLEIFGPILYHHTFRIQGKPVSLRGRPLAWRDLRKGVIAVSVTGLTCLAGAVWAKAAPPDKPAIVSVALAELPKEAQTTQRLIRAGGPFPYPKDGIVFGNRERVLPAEPRGFYREYTVKTPGARDRGARRIVCGGRDTARPVACYYTGDHYSTFRLIVE